MFSAVRDARANEVGEGTGVNLSGSQLKENLTGVMFGLLLHLQGGFEFAGIRIRYNFACGFLSFVFLCTYHAIVREAAKLATLWIGLVLFHFRFFSGC